MIEMDLLPKTEFWIYIHDQGAEYYLHYDYWPRIPASHQVKSDEEHIDMMIRKNVEHSNENCVVGDYSYFGMF